MLSANVVILSIFAILVLILLKNTKWSKFTIIIFTSIIISYMAFILSLNLTGSLINLFSLIFFSLEIFHILDVHEALKLKEINEINGSSDDSVYYTPKVSIHLPISKEPIEIVRQTLNGLGQLDYPEYEVCVILNNTSEQGLIKQLSEICSALGKRFRLFHIPHVKGFKAGALNYALKMTDRDVEIIAVVDSDYIVDKDFLNKTVKYFKDPNVAIVQTPQDYRDFPKNSFFEGMYYAYRYFFSIIMNSCNRHNAASFMGTMGLVRKKYLEEVGGWCEGIVTEDSELGIRIHERGYKTIYIDHSYGKGLMPLCFSAYKKQRFRWAFGNMQTIRENIMILLKGNLTGRQRICYLGSNTEWFNNLLLPYLIALYGILFNISDNTAIALIGPFVTFLLSHGYGFILLLPRILKVPVYKGIRALLAFFSITFPMSVAWLLCLIKPKTGFYRTPKTLEKTPLWIHLKEAGTELIMIVVSMVMGTVAFIKGKVMLGVIMVINLFIYLPSIWALKNFIELERSSSGKTQKTDYDNEDWNYLTTLETSTT